MASVTITEIARCAGVSQATVSLVLNGKAGARAAPETAARIASVAEQLQYRPNMAARALRHRRSFTLGVLMPSPSLSRFYAEVIAGIQSGLRDTRYDSVFSFWIDVADIQVATDHLLEKNLDGMITFEPRHLGGKAKMPVVTYYHEDPRYDYVGYDVEKMAETAVEYLIRLGHRKLAVAGNAGARLTRMLPAAIRRHEGVECSTWLFPKQKSNVCFLAERQSAGALPDAVIAGTDEIGLLILQWALELGIRIPRDLSVISCDGSPLGELSAPPLTTVVHGGDNPGLIMLDMLLRRIEHPELPRARHVTEPRMVERQSCAGISGESGQAAARRSRKQTGDKP